MLWSLGATRLSPPPLWCPAGRSSRRPRGQQPRWAGQPGPGHSCVAALELELHSAWPQAPAQGACHSLGTGCPSWASGHQESPGLAGGTRGAGDAPGASSPSPGLPRPSGLTVAPLAIPVMSRSGPSGRAAAETWTPQFTGFPSLCCWPGLDGPQSRRPRGAWARGTVALAGLPRGGRSGRGSGRGPP